MLFFFSFINMYYTKRCESKRARMLYVGVLVFMVDDNDNDGDDDDDDAIGSRLNRCLLCIGCNRCSP